MNGLAASVRPDAPSKPGGSSKIGLIVPSSNTTMETELPELFRRQSEKTGHRYTFHSARARLKNVTPDELARMVDKAVDCTIAVSDAGVDVVAYACLVAVMAQGPRAHEDTEGLLARAAADNGNAALVTSSAGALVRTLQRLQAHNIVMITPYVPELTALVRDYVQGEGISVLDVIGLEVADNQRVGRLDPRELPGIARRLDRSGADAIVLSACVQMPSLAAIQSVEDELGLPVITAATATAYEILMALGHHPAISGAGRLLEGGMA